MDKEEFILGDTVSDLPRRKKKPEDLESELFGENRKQKVIDAFEQQLGIKPKATQAPNLLYKNVLLSPGFEEEDSILLNQLLNDRELYHITYQSQTWTPRGEIKMFFVYTENQDVKKRREEEKKTGKTNL